MTRRQSRKSLLPRLPRRLAVWLSVADAFGLSQGHVQMARELGMTPKQLKAFSRLSPEHTWGLRLDEYIERRYRTKFLKDPPLDPPPVERQLLDEWKSKLRKRELRRQRRSGGH